MGAESTLKDKGITLPPPSTPLANYVGAVRTGNLLYLSGHGPIRTGGKPSSPQGRCATSPRASYAAAARVAWACSHHPASLGSLDRVKRVVQVLGMVNSAENFGDQPKVINGFSDLMVEVFGEAIGKHARSAVRMAGLPLGIPVEIEMISRWSEINLHHLWSRDRRPRLRRASSTPRQSAAP